MAIVAEAEYPTVKPWMERSNSLQYIPAGSVGLKRALRITLQAIVDGKSLSAPASIPDAKDSMSIADTCVRLKTIGLVERDAQSGAWVLTEEAERWLNTGDDLYLAAVICSNVRFCGEMLSHLNLPKKEKELLALAVDEYGMTWKTNSEIHARNDWFRSLGLVQHHEHSHQYELTDLGRKLLPAIEIASPRDIADEISRSVVTSVEPSQWVLDLCSMSEEELTARQMSIGHICGPSSNIATTLADTVGFLSKARTIDEFNAYAMGQYGCSKSTAQTYRSTLRILELLEDCPEGVRATETALGWNTTASPTDLACYIHSRRRCVFELLSVLKDGAKNRKDLTTAARILYGCEISRDNLSKRLNLLRNAGFVKGDRIVEATDAGIRILDRVCVERPRESNDIQVDQHAKAQSDLPIALNDLFTDLHQASQDPDNYERFENACATAFVALGFGAKHVGKSGNPDVLVTARCAKRYAYKIVVDAKSSRHPVIGINDINFDSIDKHRIDNSAQYAVVVARDFSDASVIDYAKKHDTVLLPVETLCQLIRDHMTAPISSQEYANLFKSPGLADASTIMPARDNVRRYGDLMRAIMACLSSESEDEVYGGVLSVQAIQMWMRGNQEIKVNPGMEEITTMLELLSSPMIGCVGKQNDAFGRSLDGYYAIGSLSEAANKFAFYMRACK